MVFLVVLLLRNPNLVSIALEICHSSDTRSLIHSPFMGMGCVHTHIQAAKIRWPQIFRSVDAATETWILEEMRTVSPEFFRIELIIIYNYCRI